jgi:hypothetical protein
VDVNTDGTVFKSGWCASHILVLDPLKCFPEIRCNENTRNWIRRIGACIREVCSTEICDIKNTRDEYVE